MIKKVFLLIAFYGPCSSVFVPCDEDEPCSTFDGFRGIGKDAKDCEFTKNLSGKLVRMHRCLRSGAPLVCCPLIAETACNSFGTREIVLSTDYKILGGNNANLAEFPHFASIGFPSAVENDPEVKFDCGGALISNKFVLSAAHCFNQVNRQPTLVRLGKVSKVGIHICDLFLSIF